MKFERMEWKNNRKRSLKGRKTIVDRGWPQRLNVQHYSNIVSPEKRSDARGKQAKEKDSCLIEGQKEEEKKKKKGKKKYKKKEERMYVFPTKTATR